MKAKPTDDSRDDEELEPGLYAVGPEGFPTRLDSGTYAVNDDGQVGRAANWQVAIDKIPWEKLNELLDKTGQRGTRERVFNLIGTYVLVAGILAIAAGLAAQHVIEGQALVGFLGAALGYLLARGRGGLMGRAG
jgi:hypothetical protein